MREDLPLEALTAFGIRPGDEDLHAMDPDDPTWNESIFYDWFDAEGRVAGHLRVGRLPNQARVWLWLYLFQDGEWLAVEEARLPLTAMRGDGFAYDGFGLRFERVVVEPLRTSRVRAEGFGRVVSGPRAGRVLPFAVELEARAIGPAHSVGDRDVDGHTSERHESNRFEQPIRAIVEQRIGDRVHRVDGRGERDHSWGPRFWNMAWHFLVLSGPTRHVQCAFVRLDPSDPDETSGLSVGYVHDFGGRTRNVAEVAFELAYDDALERAFEGRVHIVTEEGEILAGRVVSLGAAEIDASHVFSPPQPSVYRRGLVRFLPDDGAEPALGWLEINRFPDGVA